MILNSDTQLNQRSYYEASVQRGAALPALDADVRADVVVVGAGFTGLSAAIECAQRGLSVIVLEADRICSGASGRNGGQAIVGYASGQGPFEDQLTSAQSRKYSQIATEIVVSLVLQSKAVSQENSITGGKGISFPLVIRTKAAIELLDDFLAGLYQDLFI